MYIYIYINIYIQAPVEDVSDRLLVTAHLHRTFGLHIDLSICISLFVSIYRCVYL